MLNPTLKASRRFMKMERIARLELAGYSDTEIAMSIGITKQYVSMLRRTPEFISVRTQVASGVIQTLTNDLEEDIHASTDQLRQSVPQAVFVLRDTLTNSNPKLRLEAAKELLDREGTLAKVSKSEIKKTTIFDFNTNDAIPDDLLAALQENAKKPHITTTLHVEASGHETTVEDLNKVLTFEDVEPVSKAIN